MVQKPQVIVENPQVVVKKPQVVAEKPQLAVEVKKKIALSPLAKPVKEIKSAKDAGFPSSQKQTILPEKKPKKFLGMEKTNKRVGKAYLIKGGGRCTSYFKLVK